MSTQHLTDKPVRFFCIEAVPHTVNGEGRKPLTDYERERVDAETTYERVGLFVTMLKGETLANPIEVKCR